MADTPSNHLPNQGMATHQQDMEDTRHRAATIPSSNHHADQEVWELPVQQL